jgi:enoyl-[acyl-carrier-protein] reductase (NADH)
MLDKQPQLPPLARATIAWDPNDFVWPSTAYGFAKTMVSGSGEQIATAAQEALQELLANDLIALVSWTTEPLDAVADNSVAEIVERVSREWARLSHEIGFGDICEFVLTKKGLALVRSKE